MVCLGHCRVEVVCGVEGWRGVGVMRVCRCWRVGVGYMVLWCVMKVGGVQGVGGSYGHWGVEVMCGIGGLGV